MTLYSVQIMSPSGGWDTLLDFKWVPRGEAMGALRMADRHYPSERYRVVEDDPKTGIGKVIREGGGRSPVSVEKIRKMNNRDYGQELILDLHECDISTFTRESITNYFKELCKLINMEAEDMYFWDDEGLPEEECQINPKTCGISAVQFILTSTIVIHTLTKLGKAYINIFSCKDFNTEDARKFTIDWFQCKEYFLNVIRRR